jgi:hypothetical protein
MEIKNAYIHVWKHLKNSPPWSSRCKWEVNNKMALKETVVLNWFGTGPIAGIL